MLAEHDPNDFGKGGFRDACILEFHFLPRRFICRVLNRSPLCEKCIGLPLGFRTFVPAYLSR